MAEELLNACTVAIASVLLGKPVKFWGEKGAVVGIDLKDALPIKVLFDSQENVEGEPPETPWGFTYEQLEWFEEVKV